MYKIDLQRSLKGMFNVNNSLFDFKKRNVLVRMVNVTKMTPIDPDKHVNLKMLA